MRVTKNKFAPISGKINEGDEIEKTLDQFLKKLLQVMNKPSKNKNIAKAIFLMSLNELFFNEN